MGIRGSIHSFRLRVERLIVESDLKCWCQFPYNSMALALWCQISCGFITLKQQQSGAAEACWADNPEVRGSKPRSAKILLWKPQALWCHFSLGFLTE